VGGQILTDEPGSQLFSQLARVIPPATSVNFISSRFRRVSRLRFSFFGKLFFMMVSVLKILKLHSRP
jgi:hypothetical protein